jgi:nucleoid-associated protein YgaU
MKKRYAFSAALLFFASVFISAQSLEDNEDYMKSLELADLSRKALDNGQYTEAVEYARKSQEHAALALHHITESDTGLAAYYEVKNNPGNPDCLWNIAGYDFVYGDPYQWRRLYEANRDTFPDPDNPDWIEPGQILRIPSINNEKRAGTR